MQKSEWALMAMVVVGYGGWTERDQLRKYWRLWFEPQAAPTVVYTWKDDRGTVHYTGQAQVEDRSAHAVVVDTSRIQRLEPLPAKKEPEKKDKLALSELREDIQRGRDQMQRAREQRMLQE